MFRRRITQLISRLGQSIGRKTATVSWHVRVFCSHKSVRFLPGSIVKQNGTKKFQPVQRMYIPLGKLLYSVISSRNDRLSKRRRVNHGLSLVCYTADKGRLATIITEGKK